MIFSKLKCFQKCSGYRLHDRIPCNRIMARLCKSYPWRRSGTNITIIAFTNIIGSRWDSFSTWKSTEFRLDTCLWVGRLDQMHWNIIMIIITLYAWGTYRPFESSEYYVFFWLFEQMESPSWSPFIAWNLISIIFCSIFFQLRFTGNI